MHKQITTCKRDSLLVIGCEQGKLLLAYWYKLLIAGVQAALKLIRNLIKQKWHMHVCCHIKIRVLKAYRAWVITYNKYIIFSSYNSSHETYSVQIIILFTSHQNQQSLLRFLPSLLKLLLMKLKPTLRSRGTMLKFFLLSIWAMEMPE